MLEVNQDLEIYLINQGIPESKRRLLQYMLRGNDEFRYKRIIEGRTPLKILRLLNCIDGRSIKALRRVVYICSPDFFGSWNRYIEKLEMHVRSIGRKVTVKEFCKNWRTRYL